MKYLKKMANLVCSCCGYVGKQYPGLMYMDLFYKRKCKCGMDKLIVCSSCSTKSGKYIVGCKSCNRDKKIEELLKDE